jgi:hypothetical protein
MRPPVATLALVGTALGGAKRYRELWIKNGAE